MIDRCDGGVLGERNKANMDEESWLWISPHHHPPVTHTGDTSLGNRGTPDAEVENAMKKISSCTIWQNFWRPTVCCRHLISLIMFDCESKLWEQRAWWNHLRMTCRHRPSPGQAYVLYSWLYKLMTHEKYLTYNLHINPRGPCFTILTQKVPLKLSFKDTVINFIQHHIGCQHRSWITAQKYVVVLPGVWLSSLLHSTGMFRSFWNG